MVRHAIHISEADAVNDFVAVLSRVRAGDEIIIDGQEPVVVAVRRTPPRRLLSESIALAEAHGSTVTLDGDFVRDLDAVVKSHPEPLDPPAWE